MTAAIGVCVTDGNGQRVGRIVRFRYFLQLEECADHLLNLDFFGTPVPDHCLLDLQWCVFCDR
jgi:hypothetical protein